MKSSLTTYMKNKNRCHGSAPVFGICVLKGDLGAQIWVWMWAQRSQWMWDAVSGCGTQAVTIIYSIQTGQYSGELSANFD